MKVRTTETKRIAPKVLIKKMLLENKPFKTYISNAFVTYVNFVKKMSKILTIKKYI